mgnify:CR=1 FL=1
MPSIQPGDIVVVLFPYEDKAVKKTRPCLILASHPDGRLLAVKMTSTRLDRWWAYRLESGEACVSKGSIRLESWLNLRRRAWIPPQDVGVWCASLKPEVFQEILDKFNPPENL